MHSIGTWWMWVGFFIFVLLALIIDMICLDGREDHKITTCKALGWTSGWLICTAIFGLLLWAYLNATTGSIVANQKILEFFTGYVIEESLSMDNMFVILMIFNYFSVPIAYQRRVLLYGVLGAIVFRLLMIGGGIWLVNELDWILYVFGAFLVFTAIKMLIATKIKTDFSQSYFLQWLRRYLRLTEEMHGENFFIWQQHKLYATRLFLTLIIIEISDLIFALDSIPAVFSVTQDAFIVLTSNVFAILGLRALYFLLAGLVCRFYLLKYGIAILLAFVGLKMLVACWVTIPISIVLGVVATILSTTAMLSFIIKAR